MLRHSFSVLAVMAASAGALELSAEQIPFPNNPWMPSFKMLEERQAQAQAPKPHPSFQPMPMP